ncbi:MAG: CHAT domain-containing protein [Planctomycetes bacterium]|nr:CHAT domain-containing protein [Planctomycetota bacterium]
MNIGTTPRTPVTAAEPAPTPLDAAFAEPDTRAAVALLRAELSRSEQSDAMAELIIKAAVNQVRRDPRRAFAFARAAAAHGNATPQTVARALRVAGGALVSLGRPRLAVAHYDRALRLLDVTADAGDLAAVEVKRIHPLSLLGRHAEALAAASRALRIREQLADAIGIAEIEIALGDQRYRQDHYREALRHYTRARNCLAPDKYRRLRAIVDCNSANCLEALQRYGAASRLFERARAAFEKDGLRPTVAQVDHNRAYFAFVRGRYAEALTLYERAEAISTELGDERQLAQVALERAEVHLQMGMPRDARRQAEIAAERFGRVSMVKERAQSLVLQALATIVEGGTPDEVLDEARAVFTAEGSGVWVAECDLLAAAGAESRGELLTARVLATSAHDGFARAGRVARAVSADIVLARLDRAAGRPLDALARLDGATDRLGGLAGPWLEVEILRHRGLALLASGDTAGGAADLAHAMDALDRHRGSVPADDCMIAFLSSRSALFAETVDALLRAGRPAIAFEACERAKARALTDLLERRASSGQPAAALSVVRTRRLEDALHASYSRLRRHASGLDELTVERLATVRRETASLETELAEGRRRDAAAADESPDATASATVPLTLGRLQSRLDGDTTLIEFTELPDGLHAFVVSRTSFAHCRLGVDAPTIQSRAQRFRFHLAKFDVAAALASSELSLRATRSNLSELAAALLGPVRELITTRRLVVVPSPALNGVPFHAFPDGAGWLSETVDVAYAPSAAVYLHCAARDVSRRSVREGPTTVLAVPDDAAPLIEREAWVVANAHGPTAQVFVREQATIARFREAARTSRVLHIATHGMFRPDEPSLSCVNLADGWLDLHGVYETDVRAEIVVLSACESGVAGVAAAGDPLGLLRGFLVAGAPRVLASQWRVSDASAALFMETFHLQLAARVGAETALREARAEVRRRFPHPYHWAAFFLYGHPGGAAGTTRRAPCATLSTPATIAVPASSNARSLGRVSCVPTT